MGALRKRPRTPPDRGIYDVSGSLDGLTLGRRVVKELEVKRLDGPGTQGLAPLSAFSDLRRLMLEQVRDVDLGALSGLELELLRLQDVAGVDLGALSRLDGLRWLILACLDEDCRVPDQLALPGSLRTLALGEWRHGQSGELTRRILSAIDWARLSDLTSLDVRIDHVPPIEADLSFLGDLPRLESLSIIGVDHRGPMPSPLEPPFDGLSRNLRRVGVEADDPVAVDEALRQHAGPALELGVRQRRPYTPPPTPWAIHPPATAGSRWSAYGSLADAAGLSRDETESTALRSARTRLREADPALLRRLDFDSESSGTAIIAASREDLVAALHVLGLDRR